ncbi:DUF4145 domain-containing protein [bacterium]|nr:DUF4145 domain-containing protein [bacterium]
MSDNEIIKVFDCPHCSARCQFNLAVEELECQTNGSYQTSWICQNCSGIIVIRRLYQYTWDHSIDIFPRTKIKPKIRIDKLPENIKKDYLESLRDYGNGCYVSSVIMCRRAIQQTCLDKGAKKIKLFDQIEELNIDKNLKKLAHKLRFWGNKGAHPDILLGEKIEEKDAKIAIDFTEKFLQYVYVIPKEIEEIEGEAVKVKS